jgi:hypothetical protein
VGDLFGDGHRGDLDPDGASGADELVAIGDLDGRRSGAPWTLDADHRSRLQFLICGVSMSGTMATTRDS